jgi:cobalt-zinc-cadmium efflux system outer membrane protein
LQFPLAYTANAKAGESPYTYGLGLDIPIETAGKRGYRVAQAQQLSNAARLNIGNVAWQVRSRLRSHMLNLHAATRRVEILEQQISAQQQIVAMLDKRFALGAASAPEANQARIALTQNRIDLAHAQHQRQDERAQIAATIGVPVSAMTHIQIDFDAFERVYPGIPADDARRQAILNRADVLAALSEYEASQAALQLEIARQYPDIHIGPGYIFDAGAHKFVLPLSGITLPLFNQNQGPIAEASARRTEVAARVNAVQAQAINDTGRAVQNYRAALDNLRLAESLLSAQQRQLQDRQKTFNAGETDRLTLALAQHAFYINALARQDALVQVQGSIGQLEDAMQRPLSASDFPATPE